MKKAFAILFIACLAMVGLGLSVHYLVEPTYRSGWTRLDCHGCARLNPLPPQYDGAKFRYIKRSGQRRGTISFLCEHCQSERLAAWFSSGGAERYKAGEGEGP